MDIVFDAVDDFCFFAFACGARNESGSGRNVYETGRITFWMNIFFHVLNSLFKWLSLAGFVAWVCFADDVNTTFSANDFTVWMTSF